MFYTSCDKKEHELKNLTKTKIYVITYYGYLKKRCAIFIFLEKSPFALKFNLLLSFFFNRNFKKNPGFLVLTLMTFTDVDELVNVNGNRSVRNSSCLSAILSFFQCETRSNLLSSVLIPVVYCWPRSFVPHPENANIRYL